MHVRAQFRPAKYRGLRVSNSALDFGQLWTRVADIFGSDQAIDKRKMAFLCFCVHVYRRMVPSLEQGLMILFYCILFHHVVRAAI